MEQIIQKYLQKGEFQKALNLLEIGKKKESNNAALNYYFGKVYFQLNDHKKSLFYFRKCNQINPRNPKILYNLAQVLQGQGKIDEAKKIYEKLIKENSKDIKSYYGLFNLGLKNINDDYAIKLEKLSNDKDIKLFDKCFINFILSKLKKKENKLNEELELLKLAHQQCFNAHSNYNNQSEFYYNEIITKHYNKIKFEDDTNKIKLFDKSKPIFIVGLPRSGSTLIESLITQSSNNVNSFGELHAINMSIFDCIAADIYSKNFKLENFNLIINRTTFKNSLQERYGDLENKNFIDKSLENFLNIEIILEFFPNAKILHSFRNFNDAIISIYQKMMPDLSWSHTIEGIINYANNYKNIINYFKKKYPNNILDVNLEELSTNKETETKKIFNFCELNWNKEIFNFNKKNNLFTKTNSFLQVRDKIEKYNYGQYEPYYHLLP
jgi:tetratricopeptide (TPR) repeat protein